MRTRRLGVALTAAMLLSPACGTGEDPSADRAEEGPIEAPTGTPGESTTPPTGTPSGTPSASPEVIGRGPIPDGLDLTLGLPQDGGDFQVGPATPQGDGVGEVEVCRQTVWPDAPDAQGRLVVNASGPEYADAREVWVLPDSEAALGVVDRVSTAVQDCDGTGDEDTGDEGTGNRVWRTHDSSTQEDSITFSLTWTDGLGASVFQLTRAGRSLLMTHHYTEGTLDGVPDTVRKRSALSARLVADLCSADEDLC